MMIHQWLKRAQSELETIGISSANLDSQLILAHVLNQDKSFLLTHPEQLLTQPQIQQADALLKRRVANEPLAYIVGHKEFYGLNFKTDKRALIPRGESECMVEMAITWLENQPQEQIVAEVGTGCGAIIQSIAKTNPNHTYIATDTSAPALALAQENARKLDLKTITFLQGNLGEPLIQRSRTINLLMANLPYIPTGWLVNLDSTIRYFEPNLALDGGEDGLELYRRFLPQATQLLAPGALLLLEHEYNQGQVLRELVLSSFPKAEVKTHQDYSGHDRLLSCQT